MNYENHRIQIQIKKKELGQFISFPGIAKYNKL